MAMDSFTPILVEEKMKSHLLLLRSVLEESGTRCCTSTSRDWKTITARVKHEGLSFLTITLPQFGKDLQKGLSQSKVDSTLFVGYAKSGCLPKFLSGFISQVFDPLSGYLIDVPSIDAIHSILQLSQLMGKLEVPCSDARVRAAIVKYVDCEQQVKSNDEILSQDHERLVAFKRMSLVAFGDVMGVMDQLVYGGHIIPKHGPGSTADKLSGNAKFLQSEWPERLETVFPHGEFLFPNWRHFDANRINMLDPGSEKPVRVITVPKTLKTPRIIAVEPTCMQYAQQGLLEQLVPLLENDDLLSGMVGFTDQTPNQDLAREGSIHGTLATLDLSEASDRVSNQLVRMMSSSFPWFSMALDATRSRKADIPGYGVKRLAKFASMGSALCFPIEAMVFMTIVLLGIEKELGYPLSRADIKSLHGRVRIYGDDIIVPVEYVLTVVEELEAFGLLVNSDKSFWTGKFRESCGKEYYDGFDVSIVKLRKVYPSQRQQVPELLSLISFRNQLFKASYFDTCDKLDKFIETLIPFPYVEPTSPALGRHSLTGYTIDKMCPNLHKPLVRAYVVKTTLPKDFLSEDGALLKCLLKRGDKPFADVNHLERAGRAKIVNIKLGWVPSY